MKWAPTSTGSSAAARPGDLLPDSLGAGVGDPAGAVVLLRYRDLAALVSDVDAGLIGEAVGARDAA